MVGAAHEVKLAVVAQDEVKAVVAAHDEVELANDDVELRSG